LLTSASRCCFTSKSKIPPQVGFAVREVAQIAGDAVDAFGFHGAFR
jgi:hypothetical protein